MTGNLKIISDSRIRYIVSKGPKYRFPSRIDFKKCREEIASALNDWPTGVQLLVFFCSSVPVVLFDAPGISRCRSKHVSVDSSSLLHHSIYL